MRHRKLMSAMTRGDRFIVSRTLDTGVVDTTIVTVSKVLWNPQPWFTLQPRTFSVYGTFPEWCPEPLTVQQGQWTALVKD